MKKSLFTLIILLSLSHHTIAEIKPLSFYMDNYIISGSNKSQEDTEDTEQYERSKQN